MFSHPSTRKRVVSLLITGSVVATSLLLVHRPTSAHRLQGTVPIQYVAGWPDGSDEAAFLPENAAAANHMMTGLAVNPTGHVDRDFIAMVMPHQQGAVDMAQAVLRYGRNEDIDRLARKIIVARQQDIAAMRHAVGEQELLSAASSRAQPGLTSIPRWSALDARHVASDSMSSEPVPPGSMRMP